MCQLAISQPGSKAPFAMFHMNVSFSCLSPLSAVCQMSTGDGLWPACQHAALLFCSLYWTTIAEACSRFARVCVCVCASSLQERRVIILQFSHFSIYLQWLSLCNSDCIFVHGIWIYMIIYIYVCVCMKHECGLGFLFIVWLYSAMHLWSGVSVGCLKAEALLPVSRRISFHLQRGKWSQTEVWEALIGRLHPITARQRKLCCRAFSRAPPHSCVIPPLCDCFH